MGTTRRVFLDHVTIPVAALGRSRAFYAAALAPLGADELPTEQDGAPAVIFGPPGAEDLCLVEGRSAAPVHLAFLAASPAEVDAFHAAALAAGGTDDGAPGPRPQYHAGYDAASVLDSDGNNVEAVHHERPSRPG